MAALRKLKVPENISEEYYQINAEILGSFPKFRLPIDLFIFREDIKQLYPYSRKNQRLTDQQVEEIPKLCGDEMLFVSRADHPIYSEHIAKQVDLVLVDPNLTESEKADIFIKALALRLTNFFDQPVLPVFELLYRDVLCFTQYIWEDKHKIKLFMRRLSFENSLIDHSLNTLFVGVWLFLNAYASADFKRRQLDRSAISLILHDLGMTKIPPFILNKSAKLKPDEKDKVILHPLVGMKSVQKIELGFEELQQAIMEHHERLDGSGYPQRTKEISKFGALVAVADSFSAIISARMYSQAKTPKEAAAELASNKGYDSKYTSALNQAYFTGAFDTPQSSK